eukprot:272369_1
MEELNGPQNVCVGIIAGCIQCGLDHPLITLKNMVQQSLPLSFNPRILYRGTVADMIGLSSLTAIQFFGTGFIKTLILQNKSLLNSSDLRLTANEMLISSLGGGMLSGIVCSPWELIMIQQQRFGGNLFANLCKITLDTTLTRGMIPAMCREGIFTMGYLGILPLLEIYQNRYQDISMMNKFFCAMVSGVFATICSHPFDTVKTCMQGDLNQKHFKGTYQSFKFLYSQYGIKRIYAGASFRFGTVVLAFFVFNRVMEFIAPKIYWQQFQEFHRNRSSKNENNLFNIKEYYNY